ncbi:MAG: glutamate--tRNA ligase [Pseudomonadota bacterium]
MSTVAAAPADRSDSDAVVTRFAPSPTGFLHIGGARTALFNWLFARRHGGRFVLRIEDTDRARSTPEATEAIFAGLRWLGLDWDGEAVSQFERAPRHAEVAAEMVARAAAYRCYSTKEEIEAARAEAEAAGRPPIFLSPWRDRDPGDAPADAPYVIRLKAPRDGETVVEDAVQGRVAWKNDALDDLILLRSDGTPTYMLAVVVDDHEMGVTHVIRGDDHLTNAARQTLIYQGLGWTPPIFAHIPLIHGPDGAKLSKRHGALGVEAYREMGYLPAGMRNYLARLGWSHGDEEVFTTEQAIEWFGLEAIGKAPARLDFDKLAHVNGQHLKMTPPDALLAEFLSFREALGRPALSAPQHARLLAALPAAAERAKTLVELEDVAAFALAERPLEPDEKAAKAVADTPVARFVALRAALADLPAWEKDALDRAVRAVAEQEGEKLGKVAGPLRAALTGRGVSPGAFDVMAALGRDETLGRLDDTIARAG